MLPHSGRERGSNMNERKTNIVFLVAVVLAVAGMLSWAATPTVSSHATPALVDEINDALSTMDPGDLISASTTLSTQSVVVSVTTATTNVIVGKQDWVFRGALLSSRGSTTFTTNGVE